eukprot:TRINITY_DN74195_c0_g1_i1.p1 TRINITY_DN74195_c0_g1~~TRINITY_DN74195_c0_g1_i1.p1  ORF type:complete len:300 (-),score=66.95 TRINITY_DN74195_c0_g1_i1:2-901(-)
MAYIDPNDDVPAYRRKRDTGPPKPKQDSVMIYPVVSAAYYGGVPALGAALREGGDIDELDPKEQWRPLHAAVFTDSDDVIDYLLHHKANMNLPGPNGMTPLHLAVRDNSVVSVELLLKAKANPELTDNDGRTVWQLADANQSNKSMAMLEAFFGGSQANEQGEQADTDAVAIARAAAYTGGQQVNAGTRTINPHFKPKPVPDYSDWKPAAEGDEQPPSASPTAEEAATEAQEPAGEASKQPTQDTGYPGAVVETSGEQPPQAGPTQEQDAGPWFGGAVDPDNPINNPDLTIDDLHHSRP